MNGNNITNVDIKRVASQLRKEEAKEETAAI